MKKKENKITITTTRYKSDDFIDSMGYYYGLWKNIEEKERTTKVVNQNNKKKEEIKYIYVPEVIFNGNNTILKDGDNKVIVKKSKEDKHQPDYAFLYGYFVMKSGLSKTQANKVIEAIKEVGK